MITDILLLDFFNTLGMPTSTTVSIVFELLGSAVAISVIKILGSDVGISHLANYINTEKATEIIFGILLSVVVAFTAGVVIQFITRLFLTFKFEEKPKWLGAIFGGLAVSSIIYFIIVKGLKSAPYFDGLVSELISGNPVTFIILNFVLWSVISWLLTTFLKMNIYKIIIIMGTFALAMAFAGNDLVNFIGVPLAAYQSFIDWQSSGVLAADYNMQGLASAVQTPTYLLLISGLVMILTLWYSAKARNVVKTSVDLSRQDEGEERFQPNFLSRIIVRFSIATSESFSRVMPLKLQEKIDARFHKPYVYTPKSLALNLPAFDLVRASVNLMIASVLISMATSMKLPLSTTYVTFMVAMGSSLADRAWGPESAVYRVAGVLNVIGGWFFTALSAFLAAAFIAIIIFYGGFYAIVFLLIFAFVLIGKNYLTLNRKIKEGIREEKLEKAESRSIIGVIDESTANITMVAHRANKIYNQCIEGLAKHNLDMLQKSRKGINKLNKEIEDLKDNLFYFIKNL
ncbi:MAG: inorganic phosphate transporter, partial [Maribacter sp.]|nr:inorganic phosphate transporter [Maribacter sp.]